MSVYLKDIPLEQAKSILQSSLTSRNLWGILGTEEIPVDENALGRVLAGPLWARISSPHYHASAMDGFAVRSSDTVHAMPSVPVTLSIPSQAVYLDTGDPIPDWANAVIPIELVEGLDPTGQPVADIRKPDVIRIRQAVPPWQHVRPLGEDIVSSQLVLPAGQVLRPVDLGAAAASGHTTLLVSRQPRVTIIPTGTELVPPTSFPQRGEIIEYNSIVLAAQVKSWGALAERSSIIRDNFDEICARVQTAADQSDLVLLNAGSSAGAEDFSAAVVEKLGQLLFHGVAVRPGHPVIFGFIQRSPGLPGPEVTPIFGVPGYPVSAALTAEIFIEPLIARWLGRSAWEPEIIQAQLTRKVNSPPGDVDFLRVVVGRVGEKLLAAPLSRGAGVITSLVQADGITVLSAGVQGVEAGNRVQVRLYRPAKDIEKTIFAIGSHDMTLDLVAQFLSNRGRRLVSSNVGSLGGLVSLRRGEAHLAGCHLLDPESGEYNLSFVRQYLPDTPVQLITWVNRQQGLMVRRGNPKGIHSLEDLVRQDVLFVNRQRGAGTRLLLDHHLARLHITPAKINGYTQEEYTHLSVAAAIASGRADCGLGIPAAASALDLDFIPLFQERYDLVIPRLFLKDDFLKPLLDLTLDPDFRSAVMSLPGYDISQMGTLINI